MAAKIRKGDKVVVLAGRDKGQNGEVLKVIPKEDRAVVQGVNLVKRHTAQTARQEVRHHFQGSDDPPVEPRPYGSEDRQGRACWIQGARGWP